MVIGKSGKVVMVMVFCGIVFGIRVGVVIFCGGVWDGGEWVFDTAFFLPDV